MKRGREELVAIKEELEKRLKVLSDEKDNITKEIEKTSREIEIIEQKDFPIKRLSEAKSKEEASRLLKLYGRDKVKIDIDEETTVEDLILEKTEYIKDGCCSIYYMIGSTTITRVVPYDKKERWINTCKELDLDDEWVEIYAK